MAEVFKEIAKGLNPITKASQWAVIKQSSPGVTFLNPTKLEAASNTANAYEGSSNSTKTIVSFPSGFTDARTLGLWYGGTPTRGITTSANAQVYFFVEYNISNNIDVFPVLRFRPILSPYDLTSVTWNSFLATPPSTNAGQEVYLGTSGTSAGFTRYRQGSACLPCLTASTPFGVTYYGFIIDVKMAVAVSSGITITGSNLYFKDQIDPSALSRGVPVPMFNDGSQFSGPYILKL